MNSSSPSACVNDQSSAPLRSGGMAFYPFSHGQETCEVAQMFLTCRDAVTVSTRGEDTVVLAIRGDGATSQSDFPEVHHVARVGGDYDVILMAHVMDNINMRRVIFDKHESLPGVLNRQTFRVFEETDRRQSLRSLANRPTKQRSEHW